MSGFEKTFADNGQFVIDWLNLLTLSIGKGKNVIWNTVFLLFWPIDSPSVSWIRSEIPKKVKSFSFFNCFLILNRHKGGMDFLIFPQHKSLTAYLNWYNWRFAKLFGYNCRSGFIIDNMMLRYQVEAK